MISETKGNSMPIKEGRRSGADGDAGRQPRRTDPTQHIPIDPNAQSCELGIGSRDGQSEKWSLLAALMQDNTTFGRVKSGWWLFFRLVTSESGAIVATYDEMGGQLGVSGRTVENWVRDLERNGAIVRQKSGHRIRICLADDYMPIVQAPAHVTVAAIVQPESTDSPYMRKWRPVIESAERSGLAIELKVKS